MDGLVDLYDRTSGLLLISEADKARFRNTVYFRQFLGVGGQVWKPDDMSMVLEDYLEDGTMMLLYVDEHTPVTEALVGFALVKLQDDTCPSHSECAVCTDASETCLYIKLLAIHPSFQTRRTQGASRLEPFFERIRRFAKSRGYNCMRLTSINIRVADIYKQHAFVLERPSDDSSSAKCLAMKSKLTFGRGRKRRRFFLHFRISKK